MKFERAMVMAAAVAVVTVAVVVLAAVVWADALMVAAEVAMTAFGWR